MSRKYAKILVAVIFLFALATPSRAQTAPNNAPIQPYSGAPLCATHNDTAWHGLWDYERGCHYDHTHNDDPNLVANIFGESRTVSYPWMTPNENEGHGHPGYKIAVKQGIVPSQSGFGDGNFIPAFRIQYHDAGGNAHMVKRYHSFYAEVQIASRDNSIVGTLSTGGWSDYGCLHVPYKTRIKLLPGIDDPQKCAAGDFSPPYRAASTMDQIAGFWGSQGDNKWIWNSRITGKNDQIFSFVFRTMDSTTGLDINDPYGEHFLCNINPGAPCKYNNSEHHVFTVIVRVPASLDFDGDGVVNYDGYTDRYGSIVQGCAAPGLDCVPLVIRNGPVGLAYWRLLGGPRTTGDVICDQDIYFKSSGEYAGQICDNQKPTGLIPSGWINIPVSSEGSSPTNTPAPSGPFVSTEVNPTSLNINGTALVSVNLNNVPVEGYKSAEFTCTYNAGLVEKSNIVAANLFGADPVVAINDPQTGSFIVAIAGANSNRATSSGTAFTFNLKGLQAGQSVIQCTARVSKGDNVPTDLPSTAAALTIPGVESSPTPFGSPASTPSDHQHPTPSNTPLESPTPAPSPNGLLSGQVIASKDVTLSLLDANGVVISSAVADPDDGTFSLTALAGNYTLLATASGFLSHRGSVTLTAGNTYEIAIASLLAGDVDGNNAIDQFDALTIGMSYTTSVPAAADLNNDGAIDFLDLELLAENYRKTGPSVWE